MGTGPQGFNQGAPEGYTLDGSFISEATQVGISDTPKTAVFGAGGVSAGGSTSMAVSGELEILATGFYALKQRFRASRTGASGVSEMFFWAEVSIDGGSNWAVTGNSVDIALDSSNETTVFFDITNIELAAGTKLRSRFSRSSEGTDFGDLSAGVPSAALIALGVPTAPSTQISIYKI